MPRPPERPHNPYAVLAAAILLPGMGHVLIGRTGRGLGFAIFVLAGAWLTTKFAGPDASTIGRHAAGLFIWAVSIPDAYRSARLIAANAPRSIAGSGLRSSVS